MTQVPGDIESRAMLLTAALDALVREIALAAPSPQICLINCDRCRNHLLYLLDTAPYTGQAAEQIRARLRALPEVHKRHGGPDGPDRGVPDIRGIG
jgi:hypothetical protein